MAQTAEPGSRLTYTAELALTNILLYYENCLINGRNIQLQRDRPIRPHDAVSISRAIIWHISLMCYQRTTYMDTHMDSWIQKNLYI